MASVGLRLARTTHRCTRNQNFLSNAFVSTSKNHACVESLGPFTQILHTYGTYRRSKLSHIADDEKPATRTLTAITPRRQIKPIFTSFEKYIISAFDIIRELECIYFPPDRKYLFYRWNLDFRKFLFLCGLI